MAFGNSKLTSFAVTDSESASVLPNTVSDIPHRICSEINNGIMSFLKSIAHLMTAFAIHGFNVALFSA